MGEPFRAGLRAAYLCNYLRFDVIPGRRRSAYESYICLSALVYGPNEGTPLANSYANSS